MNREQNLVNETLEIVGGRAEAEVLADVGVTSLTRFANSFIHQNVSEDVEQVTLRVALEGRVASSTTTATTHEGLTRFVDATIETAAGQPVDEDWAGLGGPTGFTAIDHWDHTTASADPTARAEAVRAFVDAGEGLLGAGYCQTEARRRAYGNTAGRQVHGRFTTAVVDGIHQTPSSAGSGHAAAMALSSIDAGAVGALAAQRARDGIGAIDTKPGKYRVVLSPECIATIAVFLNVYGFNAKMSEEEMSFVNLGEQQFDETISIWDDPTDSRALYLPFDSEGTSKSRVDLVRSGVSTSLLHTRRTARKAATVSTGHAAPDSAMWGPFAENLFLDEGNNSVEELIAGIDRGIYVSTFNYCRVLDPKTLVVTGLTRNGTFMIENGEITHPVTDMRFTQSFVDAMAPGRVEGIGSDARFADSEFGPTFIHAPSMRLAQWNFTGGAGG
ncbi:MAG: metallopeptidase TldD-related protein [Actinomycetota bacterium]|nr:metallopeptidase TldD-related protein [Actinomycetota bacterium]